MTSREAHTLLLVHDTKQIHAGIGIHEPLARPDVVVEACTGKKEDGTYLAGDRLTQAISQGVQVEVTYPVSDGNVRDWQALEALWHYVLIEKLGIQPANNTYYVMLALPSPVSRDVYEQGAKILFEKFNAPALSMSEVPLLSAYALGVLTAMVIDIGAEDSSAVAVSDCTVVSYGIVITKILLALDGTEAGDLAFNYIMGKHGFSPRDCHIFLSTVLPSNVLGGPWISGPLTIDSKKQNELLKQLRHQAVERMNPYRKKLQDLYFEKIRVFKAGSTPEYISME